MLILKMSQLWGLIVFGHCSCRVKTWFDCGWNSNTKLQLEIKKYYSAEVFLIQSKYLSIVNWTYIYIKQLCSNWCHLENQMKEFCIKIWKCTVPIIDWLGNWDERGRLALHIFSVMMLMLTFWHSVSVIGWKPWTLIFGFKTMLGEISNLYKFSTYSRHSQSAKTCLVSKFCFLIFVLVLHR